MKIVGGSFGTGGRARIHRQSLEIKGGAASATYSAREIESVSASPEEQRGFGAIGALFGFFLLSVILFPFLNFIGVVIALVVAVAGGFQSGKTGRAEVVFVDGSSVDLEAGRRQIDALVVMKNSAEAGEKAGL